MGETQRFNLVAVCLRHLPVIRWRCEKGSCICKSGVQDIIESKRYKFGNHQHSDGFKAIGLAVIT